MSEVRDCDVCGETVKIKDGIESWDYEESGWSSSFSCMKCHKKNNLICCQCDKDAMKDDYYYECMECGDIYCEECSGKNDVCHCGGLLDMLD